MWVAIIVALVAIGSLIFHLYTPWWSTEIASNWGGMDTTIDITFWITGVAYILILLFCAYCIYRWHSGSGNSSSESNHKAEYNPENKKLEVWLTAITALGVIGLLAPGLIVWDDYVTVPEDAVQVEVMGKQWEWGYRYPGADGKLGKTDATLINDDNPFGLHLDDPNGQDDIIVEDGYGMHLQLGQPVHLLLRSVDVLHNFYVPQFRAKMDMVPGMVTYYWLTPTRTGTFDVICVELCVTSNYSMRGGVEVVEKEAYQTWLSEQETFAEMRAALNKKSSETSRMAMNSQFKGKVTQR